MMKKFSFLVLFYFAFLKSIASNADDNKSVFSYAFIDFLQEYLDEKYQKHFDSYLYVSIKQQTLFYIENGKLVDIYEISTSKYGVGNLANSEKTPEGLHAIKAKFGSNAPYCGILEARKFSNKIATINQSSDHLITSRVLWLSGLEKGVNFGGTIDTFSRLIYIHGTPSEKMLGVAQSSGCIRMSNNDVIELFNKVPLGLPIIILNN